MTLTVTLAVLASALLHASWNALVKTGADRLMMMGWIAAATGLVALPFLPFIPLPGWDVAKILCLLSLIPSCRCRRSTRANLRWSPTLSRHTTHP